ncbi:MAG: hypothetical protein WBF15_19430 [Candidatus Sulfotelmatobacter sp.]
MPRFYTKAEIVDLVQRACWLSGTGVYGWNLLWKYLGPLLEEKEEKNAKGTSCDALSLHD